MHAPEAETLVAALDFDVHVHGGLAQRRALDGKGVAVGWRSYQGVDSGGVADLGPELPAL